PFGETVTASETIANPFRFEGQLGVMDDGNGLTYMRNRYYQSSLGRFLGVDPLRVGPRELYTYAANNPRTIADPLGLADELVEDFGKDHELTPDEIELLKRLAQAAKLYGDATAEHTGAAQYHDAIVGRNEALAELMKTLGYQTDSRTQEEYQALIDRAVG